MAVCPFNRIVIIEIFVYVIRSDISINFVESILRRGMSEFAHFYDLDGYDSGKGL